MEEKEDEKARRGTEEKKTDTGFKGRWEVSLRLDLDFPMDWQLRW